MSSKPEDIDALLVENTGFKVGEYPVTCPNCGLSECSSKFCPKCGHQITARNYETICHALSEGGMKPEELISALDDIHEFKQGTEPLQRMNDRMIRIDEGMG